jgi:hypothetical protein
MNFKSANRPATARESRLARLLERLLPRSRHALLREQHLRAENRAALIELLPPPAMRQFPVGDAEWEDRVLALRGRVPSCVDRRELEGLAPGPTRCVRTGLILKSGRCANCAPSKE